jgi:hypothetical protein
MAIATLELSRLHGAQAAIRPERRRTLGLLNVEPIEQARRETRPDAPDLEKPGPCRMRSDRILEENGELMFLEPGSAVHVAEQRNRPKRIATLDATQEIIGIVDRFGDRRAGGAGLKYGAQPLAAPNSFTLRGIRRAR